MRTKGSKNRPKPTGVYLYVPEAFDAGQFPRLRGLEDEAHWLLHKIATTAARYKHEEGYSGYVQISRQTMRAFIPEARVTVIRSTLLAGGVITCDRKYRPSHLAPDGQGYSMGYALTEAFAGALRRVEVTKPILARKILHHRVTFQARPLARQELARTLSYLYGWLQRTQIDAHAAYRLIDQEPDPGLQPKRGRVKARRGRQAIGAAVPDRRALNRMTVDTIAAGEWELARCDYGRVHTNITRLLSACRACLTIDGEPLASVDIRNSQLIFLLLMLLGARTSGRPGAAQPTSATTRTSHAGDINNPVLVRAIQPITGPSTSESPTSHAPATFPTTPPAPPDPLRGTIYESGSATVGPGAKDPVAGGWGLCLERCLAPDEVAFFRAVVGGTIYDNLMALTDYTDRRVFKGEFFRDVLYGDNDAPYSCRSPITRAFRERYPSVWRFIIQQKRGGYQQLARQMQIAESDFMIGRVCGRLAAHHAEIPVLTIHDSILTPQRYLATVERVIREEFVRVGVRPALHLHPAKPVPVETEAEVAA